VSTTTGKSNGDGGQTGAAGGSRGLGGAIALLGWVGLAVFMIVAFPTFLVLAGGMAPTMVSFFSERRSGKNATLCMATLNLTGVVPVLMNLWDRGHRIDVALDLLADVFNWLIMLGPAAAALVILSFLPTVAGAVLQVKARQRLASLRARQEKLVDEWGNGIAGAED
jgi:hypothetical protein